jgi:hypothetical protein
MIFIMMHRGAQNKIFLKQNTKVNSLKVHEGCTS